MATQRSKFGYGLAAGLLLVLRTGSAAGLEPIALPPPQTEGGRPLMQALKERKSTREFAPGQLSRQQLGDLLWAAFGINRADGHRTAPSAMNAQEIDVYVATDGGLFLYQAGEHRLQPVMEGDFRPKIGGQPYVKEAPVNLLFVADFARMTKAKPADKDFYSGANTGYISQNVYLYCASEGLGTVVYNLADRTALAAAMKLRPDQKPVLGQAVGRPRKL